MKELLGGVRGRRVLKVKVESDSIEFLSSGQLGVTSLTKYSRRAPRHTTCKDKDR